MICSESSGSKMPRWGFSTSPLVDGELLLVEVGGKGEKSIVAFNKKTGDVIWSSHKDKLGYSSPIAITVQGIRQLIFLTGTKVVSCLSNRWNNLLAASVENRLRYQRRHASLYFTG